MVGQAKQNAPGALFCHLDAKCALLKPSFAACTSTGLCVGCIAPDYIWVCSLGCDMPVTKLTIKCSMVEHGPSTEKCFKR
jgi:hypothetical protein